MGIFKIVLNNLNNYLNKNLELVQIINRSSNPEALSQKHAFKNLQQTHSRSSPIPHLSPPPNMHTNTLWFQPSSIANLLITRFVTGVHNPRFTSE